MKSILLHADHLVLINDKNTVIPNGAVLVGANGRIEAVGEAVELIAANPAVGVKRLANRLLMPGLVNTHAHSGLLRGTAEGLPVWEWLQIYIDPMHRVVNAKEAEIASYLCYAEALLSGTTTIVDMWRHMHGSAKAAEQLGIRAVLVPYVAEHPDHDYFETLKTNEALIQQWHGGADGRVQVWVGLEHMFYATPEAMKRAIDISKHYQTGFHTHSNESKFDVEETQRRYGKRPVEALEDFGLLDAGQQYETCQRSGASRRSAGERCGGGIGNRWRKGKQQSGYVRGDEGFIPAGKAIETGCIRTGCMDGLPNGNGHRSPRHWIGIRDRFH
jgi:5-methylthioadenosine/S-adenosylhomocysteine deaminase